MGVSGYTGQTLVHRLYTHPQVQIRCLFSTSYSGPYSGLVPSSYAMDLPLVRPFHAEEAGELDVIFLAVPHTAAMALVDDLMDRYASLKIIDLSADFRLRNPQEYRRYYDVEHTSTQWLAAAVYGLPEWHAHCIQSARLVANPGCYATAMILGMRPLISLLDSTTPIVIDAKSGVSGGGKALKQTNLFCEAHDNILAYATGTHRHTAELTQETGFSNVLVSPNVVPLYAGIQAAIYIHCNTVSHHDIQNELTQAYGNAPFVHVLDSHTAPSTRLVQTTNRCVIIAKQWGDWTIIFSLIDNLVKGAGGQAIQNMNIMFDLDQSTGLSSLTQ